MQRFIKYAIVFLFGATLSVTAAYASEITGVVTDPTGAVLPHAKVTATDNATGTKRTTLSNGGGIYTFPGLDSGTYTLTIKVPGFSVYKQTNVVLNTAETLSANASMKLGSNSQTVTVKANALQLQSQSNEISTLISGKQMTQISTNGRNMLSLTTLGTGVSGNLPAFNGVTAQGSTTTVSFNGMRPQHNDWLIDGGEVYDRGSGGNPDVMPSPDAIAQFQILASNYPPDYGIASGGTVVITLKSGGRKFHGGLWEFNRNDALDAANYFTKRAGVASPELRLNIFGGNIGGPVWIPHVYNQHKNKTFFFVNEEWRRYIQGSNPSLDPTLPLNDFPTAGSALDYTSFNKQAAPIVPTVSGTPLAAAIAADPTLVPGQPFPAGPGGTYAIPANVMDPNAVLFMNTGVFPKPNTAGNNFVASQSAPTYVREDVVRIDENISEKYKLMGSWIHDAMSQTVVPVLWGGNTYPVVGSVFKNPSWGSAIKLTQAISSNLLNETGLYVNGNTISINPTGPYATPSGWTAKRLFPQPSSDNRLPGVTLTNGPINIATDDGNYNWHNSYLNYQIRDDLSYTHGKHALKFGFSYMREDKNQVIGTATDGTYTFNGSQFTQDSYINFLLGLASNYSQLQRSFTDHWLANVYSFYAMDNWRVTPKLSVQLGFRYDGLPHTYEKNNRVANFNPAAYLASDAQTPSTTNGDLDPTGAGITVRNGIPYYLNGIVLAGVGGTPPGLVKNDYYTPEPRVGFAYDVSRDGSAVLRGGVGIFYSKVQGNDIYDTDTTPPFAFSPGLSNVTFSDPAINALTGATSSGFPLPPASLTSLSIHYPHPGTVEYSLGLQKQLAPSVIAFLGYVGTRSWNQDDYREINDLPLSDITDRKAVAGGADANLYRPYRGFSNIRQGENATNATYDSLQASLRTASWHGFTAQFSYTWSHEIDVQSGDLGQISDPYNIGYDRGSGTLDRRNIFNSDYIYNLPWFMHSSNVLARTLLSGWTVSGVTVAESGSPVNVTYGKSDTLGLGGNTTNRPDIIGNVTFPKTQAEWFNPKAFGPPIAPWVSSANGNEGFGNARKDTIVGPGLFNTDLSIFKTFPFTRNPAGPHLQFRAATFNTFNHTEFNAIDTGYGDANFGQVTSARDPRVIQLGMKLMF